MRITGGNLVRRRFLTPPSVDEGTVRPTPDRVREAVFSMIGEYLKDASVLDLFAGSGAHGYEAISRGARLVKFVEKNPRVAAIIKQNILDLGLSAQCSVELRDANTFVKTMPQEVFDIIFVDPPYSLRLEQDFFRALEPHLSPEGVMIFRCFKKEMPVLSDGFRIDRDRSYGGTRVFVIRRALT
jgi:16S rRNA (guanine966-N2)-methyltransferase